MPVLEELLQTFYLLSFTIGLVVLVALCRRKIHRQANLILAFYVLSMLVPLWNGYFMRTENLDALVLPILNLFYPWLFGPLLYLYCLAFSGMKLPVKTIILHLLWIPGFLCAILLQNLWPSLIPTAQFKDIFTFAIFTQIFAYGILALTKVLAIRKNSEKVFAGQEVLTWQWINLVVGGFILIFTFDFTLVALDLFDLAHQQWFLDIFYVSESLYIILFGVFALRQPQLFFDCFDLSQAGKYQHSGLNKQLAQKIAMDLEKQMTEKRLYLDNELNLIRLAEQLHVSEHQLSQVLSEEIGQNFYEYINRKRVEQAKNLLCSNDRQFNNILDLAFSVGFNNKSSFNAAFKRFTQLTPSQFKKNSLSA